MARIRSIKPSFFRSEDVSVLPLRARLTWIGLWTHCDDAGRTKDNSRLIKGDIWPLDEVSLRDIEEDLETLAAHGRIVRYEVDGRRYLEITNWRDHQAIQKPTPSKLPPPPVIHNQSSPVVLPEPSDSAIAGKGKEGKGREGTRTREAATEPSRNNPADSEPPLKCEKHKDDLRPPACGACADSRRANADWHATRRRRNADAPRCDKRGHEYEAAYNCGLCRSELLAGEAA